MGKLLKNLKKADLCNGMIIPIAWSTPGKIKIMEKKVIAIFEDDEANCFIYQKALKAWEDKLEVHYFSSLNEAQILSQEIHFDMVLIDVHFRGRSFEGIRILRKLRQISQGNWQAVGLMPFIQYGDVKRLQPMGFKACLEKPHWAFDMELIWKMLKTTENNSGSRLIPIL